MILDHISTLAQNILGQLLLMLYFNMNLVRYIRTTKYYSNQYLNVQYIVSMRVEYSTNGFVM